MEKIYEKNSPGFKSLAVQANRGRALEDFLERVLESAGPGVFVLRQNNKWVPWRGGAFPQKGAPLDFVGVVQGVPVGVECKETSQARLPLTVSRFPPKEREALARFARAGGAAFLVVAFWKEDGLAVYSWTSLEKLLRTKRSLKPVDADFVLPVSRAGELPVVLLDVWRAVALFSQILPQEKPAGQAWWRSKHDPRHG